MTGIVCVEIGVLADWAVRFLMRMDENCQLQLDKTWYTKMLCYCIVVGIWIERMLIRWEWYGQLLCGVLAAYLLVASIQDLQSYEVYDFLHLAALLPVVPMIFLLPKEQLGALIAFWILQYVIFMRMYGTADAFAFGVCAVYESRFGAGSITYLLHMGLTFFVLALVQAGRRNIARSGNLKRPVALMPYITATVWLFL